MDEPVSFGRLLRTYRRARDLTQEKLAQRSYCALTTIKKIEADERRPSRELAERFAQVLELPAVDIPAFLRLARGLLPDAAPRLPPLMPSLTPQEVGAEDLSGREVHGYALRERLGIGGFGAVYRALQSSIQREVAFKIILPRYANHPDFVRRFEAEAQFVARLEHPYIVPLYDYWREPNSACLIMRYMRGGSLATALHDGPLAPQAVLQVLEQVGAALEAAHRAGVVHRDLKPANLLRDIEGNTFLADFGIAKDLSIAETDGATQAGAIVGSPDYLSPEQIIDEPITPRTDIYSLGVMLYELLTGVKPFQTRTPAELLRLHLSTPLPWLRERRPELPDALDAIIQRATAKNPAERYPSALSLVVALREILAAPSPAAREQAIGHGPQAAIVAERPTIVLAEPVVENPYKGLRAFSEADAADFYGREALVGRLLERLAEESVGSDPLSVAEDNRRRTTDNELRTTSRFLAVVGPSGSGKSSVVRAGLIPALRQGGLPGSEQWFIADCIPGMHPLEELELALLKVAVRAPSGLAEQLARDERGLLRAARLILPDNDSELVVVIDQFEEIFTLVADEAARAHFLDNLVAAVTDPRSRVRVVVTLRADFYDRPLRYPKVGELMRARTEVVLPLNSDELEQAIVEPARRAGVLIEPELVTDVARDVGAQPGALPLLQYALTELFERRDGAVLTRAAYRASGGVRGALARRAEELYQGLNEAGQAAAREIFLRLVTLGEGVEDTRRRVLRSDIEPVVTSPLSVATRDGQRASDNGLRTTDDVIDRYGRARLLTFDRDPVTRAPTVEVAHEALIREWPRLRIWLDASRSALRTHRLLAAGVAEWVSAGRDPGFLATSARLAQFTTLLAPISELKPNDELATSGIALNAAEQAYLDASLAERDRQEQAERDRQARELEQAQALAEEQRRRADEQATAGQRLRRRAVFLAGALALALIAALAAGFFANSSASLAVQNANVAQTAQAAQAIAERNFANSERLRLAAQANNILNGDAPGDVSALLAIRSLRLGYSGEADAALLRALARLPRQQLRGHTGIIESVAYAPDGRTVLTGSDDQTARLWDATTGQEIRRLVGHTGRVTAVAFSPDGRYSLTGGDDKIARLWDVATGREIRQFVGAASSAGALAFSPDGVYALTGEGLNHFSGGGDPIAHLWEVATGRELRTFQGHDGVVTAVVFSPDGQRVLTAGVDKTVRLWDAATGRELRQFLGHTDEVYSVAFSPDGQTVLTSSNDRTARLWDVATGRQIQRFNGHTHAVMRAVFSPDAKQVLTGSWDNTVRLWDVATGRELRRFTGHTDQVMSVAFSPDGKQIVSGGYDQVALIWDTFPQLEPRTFIGHTNGIGVVAFSPDGKQILSSDSDKTTRLWDVATGRQVREFAGGETDARLSPDGRYLVTSGFDQITHLWDVATGQEIRRFAPAWRAVFSPDGASLLTSSEENTVLLWNVATGQEIRRFVGHTAGVQNVTFSTDGATMLTSSFDRTARLWDVATGRELRQFVSASGLAPGGLALSPDGRFVLTGGGQVAQLWDAATGKEIRRFTGHTDEVNATIFSPDARYVLTTSDDGTARLWDAATGQEVRRFTGHDTNVWGAAFSPDGKLVVTGGLDTTLRLWRVDEQEVLRFACTHLPRDLTDDERKQYIITDTDPTCPPI